MNFTPEVIAAIETLRKNAVNDFELHRISVLEKDLTAPPKVEVVDDTHQKFNGVVYGKCKKDKHYYKNISLHKAVYEYHFGSVPSIKYDIHHEDWNPDNNGITNLKPLTRSEHHSLHLRKYAKIKKICPFCGKEFLSRYPNQKYCSRDCYSSMCKIKTRICPVCGKEFTPYQNTSCCSKSCAAKLRIRNADNEEKICPICGEKFIPEMKRTRYCSRKCYQKAQQKSCICVVCGEEFINKSHAKVLCCSKYCANKLRWQTRKSDKK